jgi:uncharacterized delta-60 repeat protein
MKTKTDLLIRGLMIGFYLIQLGVVDILNALPGKENRPVVQQETSMSGKMDCARDLVVDSQGNAYVTGYSYQEGSDVDFATVKYNSNGHLLWTVRYDGPAHLTDYAETMALAGDDGVVVAGHSNGLDTSLDMTVVRYDKNGHLLWTARYDGPSHRDDYAQDIAVDAKGDVVVTGYSFGAGTEHDYITVKYNSQGNQVWEARHNASINRDDAAKAVALDSRGFAYVAGTDREGKTSYDFATIKYDRNGREIWTARYSGPDDAFDTAEALAVDVTGCIYVTGYGYNDDTEYDIVTVKYDSDGRLLWSALFNGPADRIDTAAALALDNGGNIYITGCSYGLRSAADIVTIKYDGRGRQIWAARYDGPAGGADGGSCIIVDSDTFVTVAGSSRGRSTDEDIVLLKYDSRGRPLWESRYDGPDHGEDRAAALSADSQGNCYVAGYSYGDRTEADYILLKYDSQGRLLWMSRLDGAMFGSSDKE